MTRSSSELERLTNELPHPLAVVLREYLLETNDYNKLWRLVGAAELLVRFLASVALGEVFAQGGATLPPTLQAVILRGIERPTFGLWIEVLRESMQALSSAKQLLVPELPALVEPLFAIICPPKYDFTNSLLSVRNVLGHDMYLSRAQIRAALYEHGHKERFEGLLLSPVSAFLSELALVGVADNSTGLLLRGIPHRPGAYPAFDLSQLEPTIASTLPPGAIVLSRAHERRWLSLFPLQAIGPIMQRTDRGLLPTIVEPIAQVYARREAPVLHYVALDDRLGQGDGTAAMQAAFDLLFPLDRWRAEQQHAEAHDDQQIALGAATREYGFREIVKELSEPFVGRDEALKQVLRWLAERATGAGLLLGSPGSGKTAFAAKVSTTIAREERRWLCIRYFFMVGDARCNTRAFMKGVLLQLQLHALKAQAAAETWHETFASASKTFQDKYLGAAPPRDQQAEARQAFCDVLRHFSAAYLGPTSAHDRLILLVDGLDEIAQVDPQFLDLVHGNLVPGVVWLVLGRPDTAVLTQLPETSVERLLPGDSKHAAGLRPLDLQAVRQLLVDAVDWRRYQLFAVEDEDRRSPFVDRLVQQIGGLPLYLRLLVDDLRKGRFKFERPDELPGTLESYYDRLLERLTLDAARKVLPDVVALLAIAETPLTDQMLSTLLSDHDLRADRDWELLFQQTLRLGHTLLRDGFLWDETIGHTLYHASFRTHLLHGEEKPYDEFPMGPVLRKARRRVLQLCEQWSELPPGSDERRYALLYAVSHFLEANDLAAVDRLTQGGYFEALADELGTVEALLRAREVVDALAKHDETYFPALRRAALAYCQFSEELRGAPETIPRLIRRGEIERVRGIVAGDPDPLRQACLRLAIAPLLSAEGHVAAAEEFWESSSQYLLAQSVEAWKQSGDALVSSQCLALALLSQGSFTASAREPVQASPTPIKIDLASPATTTIPWLWRIIGFLNSWRLLTIFMLGMFTVVASFFTMLFFSTVVSIHESDWQSYADTWWGKILLYSQIFVCGGAFALTLFAFLYTPLMLWYLRQRMDAFLDAYEQGIARETDLHQRRRLVMTLVQFLNTGEWEVDCRPWATRLAVLVARQWEQFIDNAPASALYLVQSTALGERATVGLVDELLRLSPKRRAELHVALGSVTPFGPIDRTWFGWIDALAQRFMMFKNARLLRYLVATAEQTSPPAPILDLLAMNEPLATVDREHRLTRELRVLPPGFLGRALLTRLAAGSDRSWRASCWRQLRLWRGRVIDADMTEFDFSSVLARYRGECLLLVLWLTPVLLVLSPMLIFFGGTLALGMLAAVAMLGVAILVGRIRRQVPIPTQLDSEPPEVWRRWLAAAEAKVNALEEMMGLVRRQVRHRLRGVLLAQQIYRQGFESVTTDDPAAAKHVLMQMARSGVFASRANMVRAVMGDRRMLSAALAAPPVGAREANTERAYDDIAELRRWLPMPSTLQSLVATLSLSIIGVSLWLTAIWNWVPAVRTWLWQYGYWELGLLALALVVLQHLPPLGRLMRRVSESEMPPAIETMTLFSGWRMIVLVPLIIWIHTRTFVLDLPLKSLWESERTAADWLTIVIPASVIVITNLFVPELVSRWRGVGLFYPTRRQYVRHRLKWCSVFVAACLALAGLAWMLAPSA